MFVRRSNRIYPFAYSTSKKRSSPWFNNVNHSVRLSWTSLRRSRQPSLRIGSKCAHWCGKRDLSVLWLSWSGSQYALFRASQQIAPSTQTNVNSPCQGRHPAPSPDLVPPSLQPTYKRTQPCRLPSPCPCWHRDTDKQNHFYSSLTTRNITRNLWDTNQPKRWLVVDWRWLRRQWITRVTCF